MDSTITTETNQVFGLFTCLRGCRRASDGTDGTCLLTSHHFQETMDEDLEKRVIETMPVVSSLCLHAADQRIKQATVSMSGVTVVRSRWGPSASRANVPLLVTAYVNLDD
jgi:hypothetical protein